MEILDFILFQTRAAVSHDKEHKVRAMRVWACWAVMCSGAQCCVCVLFSVLFWLWQFSLCFFGALFLCYSILKHRVETHRIFSDLGLRVVKQLPLFFIQDQKSLSLLSQSHSAKIYFSLIYLSIKKTIIKMHIK